MDDIMKDTENEVEIEKVDVGLLGVVKTLVTGGEEKQKMLAQFNKINGAPVSLISFVDINTLNTEDYVYIECYGSPFNDRLVGTVDNFTIKSPDEVGTLVTENNLNQTAIDRIVKQYGITTQVNIMRKMLIKMCEILGTEDNGLLETEEFKNLFEMDDYIKEVLRVNKAKKEYYAETEGFEYVSNEQQEREFDATLEGGIRDTFGPRQVGSTERIFS